MSLLAAIRARLRLLLRRREAEDRMTEEFHFHVDMQTQAYAREGMDPAVARRRALIDFGGVEAHKETMREQRGWGWIEDLARDARTGIRSLLRAPGFTLAAVLTIAVGVGATTLVFSLLNAALWKPLPIPQPGRVVVLTESRTGAFAQGLEGTRLPYARYVAYRETTGDVLTGLAAPQLGSFALRTGGESEPVRGVLVAGVALVLTCVAVLACALPVRRVLRLDPVEILRAD
jgi:hypothetical protein